MQYEVPKIPSDLYKNNPNRPLGNEEILAFVSEKIEYVPYKGILLFIQGAEHPKKGFPTPEAVAALNIIKSLLLQVVKYPTLLLISNKNKLITSFNIIFHRAFSPYLLNEEFLCPTAYNTMSFINNFLSSIGIQKDISKTFSYYFAHLLEYDDAYRYRMQDIVSETTSHKLKDNPIREIKRLLQILKDREPYADRTPYKIESIILPVIYLLIIPKYRKAFTSSLTSELVKGMQYDEADKYWACIKGDNYMFTGRDRDERIQGLKIPTPVRVDY